MDPDPVGGADPCQKTECLDVAAEQDVLPVVHAFTGFPIRERGRPAAKPAASFENENPHAMFRQQRGRTQPGETTADDDDGIQRRLPAMILIHV